MTDNTEEDPYHDESWAVYRETLAAHRAVNGPQTPDFGAYLPSPDEIKWRGQVCRWLTRCGFSPLFCDSVMIADTPPILVVIKQWNETNGDTARIEKRWESVIKEIDDADCDS